MLGAVPVTLFFFVAQVNGVIDFLASGVEACDEHHLVAFAAAHDLVVDALNVVTLVNGNVVDVGDDESVADACILEFTGLDTDNLKSLADGEVFCLVTGQLGECATQ